MTLLEMHFDFDLKKDRIASMANANYTSAEKDWLFREASWVILKQRYGINNNQRAGFESNQKRIDDLSWLHIKYPNQPGIELIVHDNNVYELDLSELSYPYLFLTRGWVEILKPDCPTTTAKLKLIQNDDLLHALEDPFNQSSEKEILVNFGRSSTNANSSIYFYPGTLTLGKAFVEYVKSPIKVNLGTYTYLDGTNPPLQESDFPEHMHPEIVDVAVEIAAGIVEDPATGLKSQKVFKHE